MSSFSIIYRMNSPFHTKTVCIIGAGVSGMTCGNLLKKKNFNVIILEASDTFGGRIRSLKGFTKREINLGAEEIHGNNSLYYNLASDAGADIYPYCEENKIYSGYKGEFSDIESLSSKYKNFKYIWDLFEDTSYNHVDKYPDISVKDYLIKNNIPNDVYFLANAMFAIESGTDLDKLSIGQYTKVCLNWKAGEENYLINNMSQKEVIQKSFINILNEIQYNKQVQRIKYENDSVIIHDQNGNEYLCDYCIITVPITQIKKLNFEPKLSKERIDSFNKLEMDDVSKIILKFKKSFWPEDTSFIVIPGNINLFWPLNHRDTNEFVLIGLTSGKNARELNHLYIENNKQFIERVINEIELSSKCKVMDSLIDYLWFDWKRMPFIEGGYTYPIVEDEIVRNTIRDPIDNKLFFAGEAYARHGHIATIHGAIETAYETVEKIENILQINKIKI